MQKVKNIATKITNPKLGQMLQALIAKKESAGPDAQSPAPTSGDQVVLPKPILPKTLSKSSYRQGDMSSPLAATATFIAAPSMSDIKTSLKFKLADLDPLEVARQITLIEYDLFSKIKPREFVGLSWMKDDKETLAPNIMKMIRWSNHIITWIVTEIVTVKDHTRSRVSMYERVISIAKVKFIN